MMLPLQKKHLIIGLINVLLLFNIINAQNVKKYNIEAKIHPDKFKIEGKEEISFHPKYDTNNLKIHLYWNSLNKDSILFKHADNKLRSEIKNADNPLSYIKLHSLNINGNKINKYSFGKDKTILKINYQFTKNKKYNINIEFESKIPNKRYIRYGYSQRDKIYWISQWYPKIAFLEGKNSFQAAPFHYDYEFFSEYTSFNIKIILPDNFKVFSNLKKEKVSKKNNKIIFEAKDKQLQDVTFGFSKKIYKNSASYKNKTITIYSYKENKELFKTLLKRVKKNLKYIENKVGPYSPEVLKILYMDTIGLNGQGMEYPKLIQITPQRTLTTLDHELCHQWFYYMIGFNQPKEPWLDEGFTSYYETRLGEFNNKKNISNLLKFNSFDLNYVPLSFFWEKDSSKQQNVLKTYKNTKKYDSSKSMLLYYIKTPMVIKFLESEIGKKQIDKIFQTIYNKYKFKHPSTENILQIFKKNISKNNYNIFYNNLTKNANTDVSITKKGNSLKITKGNDYNKPVKLFVKENSQTKKIDIKEQTKTIKTKNLKYAYINIIDPYLRNNYYINNSTSFFIKIILLTAIIAIFYFLSFKSKNDKLSILSKNIFYNLIIFSPVYIYLLNLFIDINTFNKIKLPYNFISPMLNKIIANPPFIVITISALLYLIKISIFSIQHHQEGEKTYSIFSILLLDLMSFFIIALYITVIILMGRFSFLIFALFMLLLSLIEPLKMNILKKDLNLLKYLPQIIPSYFIITLISIVLGLLLFLMTVSFFIKTPFIMLVFVAFISIIEHLYRWGFEKVTFYNIERIKNHETKKENK